jgi:hypothetical protein
MSVDSKIKQLLERLEARKLDETEQMGAGSVKKDSTLSAKLPGDASNPKQGSSEDASFETRDENQPNQGAIAANPLGMKNNLTAQGPGQAPNFTTVANQPSSAVNQSNSKGNVHKEADETNAEETVIEEVTEDEVSAEAPAETVVEPIDLSPIFGADLSEDFKEKATSIFEAAVVARVNHEMEKINAALDEKFAEDVAEFQKQIVEKVDSYLNYVVENWMKENEVAIESGLRTEIAEDFIQGLQVLFKEHYIEVPEEKYDVIGELEAQTVELTSQMDDIMSENVQLKQQVVEMKRLAVIEEMSKDLAATDASRLAKLLEGVQFEDEQLYREKVSVIVENFISKPSVNKTVTSTAQPLVEDVAHAAPAAMDNSIVNQYAQALSRTIKKK